MIDDYLQPTQPVVSDEERGRQVIADNQAVIQQFLSQPHITQLFKDFKDEDGNPVPPSLKQIHLHLHTPKGSLLDGFARIDDLMPLSREYGMPAVGVSEHGTMASHFDFYHAANKAGIKPIMGMEAYVTPNHKWKKVDFDRVFYIMENYGTEEEPSIHPKLFHMSAERMQAEGYTNVLEIKDSSVAKTMARIVESYFIREIKHEYAQREEKAPNQAAIKKEVTRRKTASTRQGLRFCVKEKTQVRDLFTWRPHNNNHLLLIARTQEGYSNMLKLCSTGFLEGFYRKPRVDPHLLKKHGKGLIATSACLGSDINQCLLLGRDRVAKNLIKFYKKIFDEFYLEIQPSEQPEQHYVNKRLKEFSKEMDIPLICTTDVHMLKKEEKSLHATITTIGKSEDTDGISVYDSCYFMSTEEILGKGIPIEAVMNTMEVASKCNVTLADDSIKFPVYDVPEGETFDSYLRQLSSEALFNYALSKNIDISLYMERLNYELEVVANKNISAYFIIVWDYIKFARDRSILVGPGRGSAAGSLISFLLRITNLDPIKYDLLFSRFINPERPGFPDVDSDFDDKRRHEVIEYVTNKYGADRVSQIGTFSMLNTKSVLKDVGRSLGIDHVEINSMNKFVPVHQGKSPTVDECLTLVPEFEAYEQKYPELFKTAIKIQGMPRTSSVHACGIMITPTPIDDFVPLTAGKNGERVSQYDGPSLEKSGLT